MVSKKSDIMRENAKTSSVGLVTTLAMPITPDSSARNGAPKEEKSRPDTMPAGSCVTPRGMPATTATMMPSSSEPLTFIAYSTIVAMMEMRPTRKVGLKTSPRATIVDSSATMMPPSLRPIIAMNRPRPTEIA